MVLSIVNRREKKKKSDFFLQGGDDDVNLVVVVREGSIQQHTGAVIYRAKGGRKKAIYIYTEMDEGSI